MANVQNNERQLKPTINKGK